MCGEEKKNNLWAINLGSFLPPSRALTEKKHKRSVNEGTYCLWCIKAIPQDFFTLTFFKCVAMKSYEKQWNEVPTESMYNWKNASLVCHLPTKSWHCERCTGRMQVFFSFANKNMTLRFLWKDNRTAFLTSLSKKQQKESIEKVDIPRQQTPSMGKLLSTQD